MRGGQYVNDWRMAQLHAQEAPARVRELEAWGAVFDRTPDGRILQRNFGGHKYPRLAHVGDRTGLEMIRTLQDHGIHKGIQGYMEYTVVRHTLAYDAGAELKDMEFVQFHPTGMIWPPSVQGILVTEGVRGEGGILLNSKGEQFMYRDIPDAYKNQTAKDPEEGWRYCTGDRNANRPAELLTRDHVARCILREVREGRGSPHGGVFLDISWIKAKIKNAPEHIKRKLPNMYHQFKELGNIDITSEPMEVGPTTHYIMGGVRVDAESQMSRVPGLFACGECAVGINGANRLGGQLPFGLLVVRQRAG